MRQEISAPLHATVAAIDPDATERRRRGRLAGIALGTIHLAALAAFVPRFFSWPAVAVCWVLVYVTGGIGICLGYHRLLTHRSLRVPKLLERAIVTCGALALQGGPITWIATHRAHHLYSDTDRDPHNARRGFFWSHVGWLFCYNPARLTRAQELRAARDIASDPYYRFLESYAILVQLALAAVLFACGGISWVIWGIFVRLVVTYHVTWLVNSSSHMTGYRRYRTDDLSTNCWWVALLASGEGWHNNHHAFPFSARHGLRWYEFDATWVAIRVLALAGLATNVRTPSAAMLHRFAAQREIRKR
ncbi:MAG TPA: fatty acid desaturase [Candidatus Acidoferrales bacterium]|nr:fatty acid desaturase [Candidatus Acidoferrales bacterium]